MATWDYLKASQGNVFYVAEIIYNFIEDLMKITVPEQGIEGFLSRTALVGHSLGAHIAGRTGNLFKGRIGKIIGLDPAGPLFAPYTLERHCLSHRDAIQVHNLHTATAGNGNRFLLGSKDFYVNGGTVQPELKSSSSSLSHKRATNIFRASIYRKFLAKGYYCKVPMRTCNPRKAKAYYFDIDDEDRDVLDAPIYLPTIGTQPFFANELRLEYVPKYKSEIVNGYKKITYIG